MWVQYENTDKSILNRRHALCTGDKWQSYDASFTGKVVYSVA